MRAIRLTLIITGAFLVLSTGVGYLVFREPKEPTAENTNQTPIENVNVSQTNTTPGVVPEEPIAIENAIRAVATVFTERFESYNEQSREEVLSLVRVFLTPENAARLERDLGQRKTTPTAIPRIHTAHVVAVEILSQTEDRASVDVHLRIELATGNPPVPEEPQEKTVRLLMVKTFEEWKIENAAL